jgi:YbgC/YbaW family acyl-CoA thioester hydrolase
MTTPPPWPFRVTVPTRFVDLDAMGHVNNATYLTYLEQARNECWAALRGPSDPDDLEGGLDFVVAHVEIDYVRPVGHGDAVTVTIRPEAVGRTSFALAYEGHDRRGELVLRARSVQVAYDWAARAKKPVPSDVARALAAGAPAREAAP